MASLVEGYSDRMTSRLFLSLCLIGSVASQDFSLTAIRPRSAGSNQTSVQVGSGWYLPVHIGTPPQTFLMTPDSGAPGLAVKSALIPLNETSGTSTSPLYNPNDSSTASVKQGYTYINCFGSGHCDNGLVYNDIVTVGNISVNMGFEVPTHSNGIANGGGVDGGNFGLNLDRNGMTTHPSKIKTWLQTVLPFCSSQVFTIDFDEKNGSGTFDFGYIDSSKYNGDIAYTPVIDTSGEWSIQFSGFQAGSNGTFNSTSWKAIVDSGTRTSGVPKSVLDGYFKSIPKATYDVSSSTYKYPCSQTLPDFVFEVAGTSYRGRIPLSNKSVGGGLCKTKLTAGTGTVIFGQDFIEAQFVVFDYAGNRVGFANKGSNDGIPTETSSGSISASTESARVSTASQSSTTPNSDLTVAPTSQATSSATISDSASRTSSSSQSGAATRAASEYGAMLLALSPALALVV